MNNNSNGYRTSKRIHVVVLKLVTDWEEVLREQIQLLLQYCIGTRNAGVTSL